MAEYFPDEEQESRKEIAQDYYAGYYWGNDPYDSCNLPGRKSDSEIINNNFATITDKL